MLLPVDITTQILVRLPVRSLLRFRSVCSTWRETIDDQVSVSLHVNSEISFSKKGPTSFFLCTEQREDELKLYLVEQHEEDAHMFKATKMTLSLPETIKIEQLLDVEAARGLFHVSYFGPSSKEGKDIFYDIICNPFTGKFLKLPVILSQEEGTGVISGGFGYDSCSRKFKLLRIFRSWITDEIEVLVFTLGSKSWKKLGNLPKGQEPISSSILIYNMLHWFPRDCIGLVTFDLASETFGRIQLPESRSSPYPGYLDNLDGCLSFTDDYLDDRVEIWVMKDYGVTESWTRILILRGDYESGDYVLGLQPLTLLNNIEILLLCGGKNLKVQNVDSGTRTPCHIFGLPGNTCYTSYSYCGNLLSLRPAE